jgi:hypothetical protein
MFSVIPYVITISRENEFVATFPFEKQGDQAILIGMKKVLGGQEITDYGDILTRDISDSDYRFIIQETVLFLKKQGIRQIIFDYVRDVSPLCRVLKTVPGGSMQKQEVAPFISLPDSWEAYLDLLPRIERKELKRKLRRLETVPHSFEIVDAGNETVFNEFIRLHRLSDRSKEQFMSPAMERFFRGLAFSVEGAWKRGFAVLSISGKPAGIIFYFEHEKHALLYNSGFDPEQRYYSSGLMTHALLIRRNIEKGIKVHDFLRGSERYKYDLGAKDINLYKISINL